jgi:mycothiol system anti-sigma-R factor
VSEIEIDCTSCQEQVHEFLQSELTDAELAVITAHIANCDTCDEHYHVEDKINQLIRTSCAQEETPADILAKVREQLNQLK